MSRPLTINRIWGKTLRVLGTSKLDARSSPHLFTSVAISSLRVQLSGTESSTSPWPRIFAIVKIVRTLTVINIGPLAIGDCFKRCYAETELYLNVLQVIA